MKPLLGNRWIDLSLSADVAVLPCRHGLLNDRQHQCQLLHGVRCRLLQRKQRLDNVHTVRFRCACSSYPESGLQSRSRLHNSQQRHRAVLAAPRRRLYPCEHGAEEASAVAGTYTGDTGSLSCGVCPAGDSTHLARPLCLLCLLPGAWHVYTRFMKRTFSPSACSLALRTV